MIATTKWILVFCALAAVCSSEKRPGESNRGFRVIDATPLECEEKCEIRLKHGDCKVDIRCLIRNLFPLSSISANRVEVNDGKLLEDKDDVKKACRGKCLFDDKKGNCRLDFICLLDRDVEGTLRYLVESNVDAETAIHLALSASSRDTTEDDTNRRRCKKYVREAPAPCDDPCEYRDTEGKCRMEKGCTLGSDNEEPTVIDVEKKPKGGPSLNVSTSERVAVVPHNACPGKCKVRNTEGKCVVDYDCANSGR